MNSMPISQVPITIIGGIRMMDGRLQMLVHELDMDGPGLHWKLGEWVDIPAFESDK